MGFERFVRSHATSWKSLLVAIAFVVVVAVDVAAFAALLLPLLLWLLSS